MYLRQLAVAAIVLPAVRPILAEESPECVRAGNYGGRPVSLGLIAPHPIEIHKAGPRLIAPTNYPADVLAHSTRMNDTEVRLASKDIAVATSKPDVHVNDIVTAVLDECILEKNYISKSGGCSGKCDSQARMAVQVAEILPNGTLAIKGRSETECGGEICEQSISGKVLPQSVTPDRCVNQRDISELRIRVRKHKLGADTAVQPAIAQEFAPSGATCCAATKAELLREKEIQLASLQQEVNHLRGEVSRTQQILVKIQMLEVSLTKLRKMGFEFSIMPGRNYNASNLSDFQKIISDSPIPFSKTPARATQGMIDWLCENQVAKAIANPNIVVMSGRPAEFCIGGEVPIPGRKESAAVEFQKIGTQVNLVASAIGEDRVHLEIRTRISDLDESRSVRVGDSVVPAFKVRECDTAIESKFDQSTVLCGGIENRTESVGKVGEDGDTKCVDETNEVALIVVVTPEAVGSLGPISANPLITK